MKAAFSGELAQSLRPSAASALINQTIHATGRYRALAGGCPQVCRFGRDISANWSTSTKLLSDPTSPQLTSDGSMP